MRGRRVGEARRLDVGELEAQLDGPRAVALERGRARERRRELGPALLPREQLDERARRDAFFSSTRQHGLVLGDGVGELIELLGVDAREREPVRHAPPPRPPSRAISSTIST